MPSLRANQTSGPPNPVDAAHTLQAWRVALVTASACVRKPARLLLGSRRHRRRSQVDFGVELRTGAVSFRRLALDLVLANEPQCKHRTGQAEEAREGEHVVQSGEETLVRGVRRDRLGAVWKRRERVAEVSLRGGFDEMS